MHFNQVSGSWAQLIHNKSSLVHSIALQFACLKTPSEIKGCLISGGEKQLVSQATTKDRCSEPQELLYLEVLINKSTSTWLIAHR